MEEFVSNGTALQFFGNTEAVWRAMYRDCQEAKKSIAFEQYILTDDPIGKRFMKLFSDKAEAGINIHLILDMVGSRDQVSSEVVDKIQKAGGSVIFYRPLKWLHFFTPSIWYPRNHCKTMIIDDNIAYIGSSCIADRMRSWRELHARFTGPLVEDAKHDFSALWNYLRKNKDNDDPNLHPVVTKGDKRELMTYHAFVPRLKINPVYQELLRQVKNAKREICIVSPFFIPPILLMRRLRRAIRRGVIVTIMIPKVSDIPLADHVAHSYFSKWLKNGFNILLYTPTVLHAKYIIVDDDWATFGSTNIDSLSIFLNREANIVTRDPVLVNALRNRFLEDTKYCIKANRDFWQNKPLHHKLIGYLGRSIKRIL